MEDNKQKTSVVVICGPTGIGKTSSAIGLSRKYNGLIISADSMQIYRKMDIGTAKPTSEERSQVEHFLVDVADPDEDFDAARFALLAGEKIDDFKRDGILPFVAGGTGLYIKALTGGLFRARPADPEKIEKISADVKEFGSREIHKRLAVIDPEGAKRIHPNDSFRIIRALEVFESTGKTMTEQQQSHGFQEKPYRVLKLGLNMDREKLYERINLRVDMMLDEGFEEEVRNLLAEGYSRDLKSMRSLGYKHLSDYIHGDFDRDETVRLLKRDTRRYAKRQLTWFRADPEIVWCTPGDIETMSAHIDKFLM